MIHLRAHRTSAGGPLVISGMRFPPLFSRVSYGSTESDSAGSPSGGWQLSYSNAPSGTSDCRESIGI